MKKLLPLFKFLPQIPGGLLSIVLVTILAAGLPGSSRAYAAGTAKMPNAVKAGTAKKTTTVSLISFKQFDNETTPTTLSLIKFTLKLSANLSGATKANFQLGTVGNFKGASIKSVITLSGSLTVNVLTGTGEGYIWVNMINSTGISQTISTDLPYMSDPVLIKRSGPDVDISAPSTTLAGSGPLSYKIVFADAYLDTSTIKLTANKVILNKTGTVAVGSISVTGSDYTRTVQLSNISGDGTVSISLPDSLSADVLGNWSVTPYSSFITTIDNTPPTITISPPSTTLEATGTITYTVTYSDTNLDPASITLASNNLIVTKTNTAAVGVVSVSGSGNTRTVQLKNVSGDGDVSISIPAGTAADLLGNKAVATGPSAITTIDDDLPTTIISTPLSIVTKAGPIAYEVSYSDPNFDPNSITLSANDVQLTKTGTVVVDSVTVSGTGSTRIVTLSHISGDGTVQVGIAANTASDLVGHLAKQSVLSFSIGIDNTAPTITISNPSVSNITAGSGSVSYTVTYDGIGANSSSLSPDDIILNTTGSASGTVTTSVAANINTVTISNITGAGTLGISIAPGSATDHAGNSAAAAGPSATFGVQLISQAMTVTIVPRMTYGDADLTLHITTANNDFPPVITSSDTSVVTIVNGNLHIVRAGTTSITVSKAADATHSGSLAEWVLTVNPAPLTVTADNKTINYGAALPAFTATYSGFVNGDGQAVVTTPAVLSTTATVASAPGNYPITASGAAVSANYTISYVAGTLKIIGSNNTALAGLSLSSGSISPAFSPAIYQYSNTVPFSTSSITVTPTTGDPYATVKISGNSPSIPVSLNVGANFIYIGVTAANGATFKLDTLIVTRIAPSTDATLANLIVSSGTLSPAFSRSTSSYTDAVAFSNASIIITPTPNNPNATVHVNGNSASTPVNLNVGNNFIVIAVTAQNGSTTTLDTLRVTRNAGATDATLAGLSVSSGTLSPVFSRATHNYKDTVAYSNGSITITPTTSDPNATAQVNSHPPSTPVALNVGSNFILLSVTAQNGTTTTYDTLKVTRAAPSADAAFAGLTVNKGVLSPAFSSTINRYRDTVSFATTNITCTPTAHDPNATALVNGNSPSTPVTLNVGNNIIMIEVIAQNGATTRFDTLTVNRIAPSADATLAGLTVSSGTLSPAFSPARHAYKDTVAFLTASITITPALNNPNATVKINSNSPLTPVNLNVGLNFLAITVTAQNGTTATYDTLMVTRIAPSADAALSNLTVNHGTLSPAFSPSTHAYNDTVAFSITNITVTPTPNNPTATAKVNSHPPSTPVALNVGFNFISIPVTAQNGTTTIYDTLMVTRLATSSDAALSSLTVSSGSLSPAFSSGKISYADTVNNTTASVTLTPIQSDMNAITRVNGTIVGSGAASAAVPLAVGLNTIGVVVTAQDGTTTKTYTVEVLRKSNDATLLSLTLSSGTLSPIFAGTTITYTATVVNSVASIMLTPVKNNTYASISVNGSIVNSGSASPAQALVVGINVIKVMVTAQNGAVKPYTVTVTRQSNDATLSALTLSSGTLSPVFAGTTVHYKATVSYGAAFMITPTKNNVYANIAVNGTAVASGTASPAQVLSVGANTINVVVTAQNGAVKTYTLTVTRLASATVATLSALTISSGTLSPVFSSGVVNYADTVNNSLASITVTPTQSDVNATIKVNGITTASGSTSAAIALSVGANNINVAVTAQDGTTTKTYTINVIRKSNDATLSALTLSSGTLSPVFASTTVNYTASVGNSVSSIMLTPTKNNIYAAISINGSVVTSGSASTVQALALGTNVIHIIVTAQNGATKSYNITVTRLPASTVAALSNLTINSGVLSPAFSSGTMSYTDSVSNATASVTVTPSQSDIYASIQVNGATVVSGQASASIPLSIATNTITVVVTAQDGVTTQTYTLKVTRLSNNADLSNLVLSSGTLSPAFASATIGYTASVSNTTSSITLTPTKSNGNTTIGINGIAVASGKASAAQALAIGANTINIDVTAQNGRVKTYTVTVTRASGGLNSLYLPGGEQTPLVSSLGEKVEANNILSPNGDGINDIWVVKNIAFYPNNTVTVYNRAGEVVFTQKGYANDWTGAYRGSVLSEGSYYYTIDLGNGTNVKGFITVVRNR